MWCNEVWATKHSMLEIDGLLERVCGIKANSFFIPGTRQRAPKTLGISLMTEGTFVVPYECLPPILESMQRWPLDWGTNSLRRRWSPREQTP